MYKVTNKLSIPVKFRGILFKANETKVLEEKPYSDKFHVEKEEKKEKPKALKGGK